MIVLYVKTKIYMKNLLSLEKLERLGVNKNGTFHFDLSALDIDYLEPFFNSIYNYCQNTIKGIGFNLDLSIESTIDFMRFRKSRAALHAQHHPKPELESSAYKNRPKLVAELAGLISRFLPRSESLRILKFRSIPFSFQDIDVLSQSVMQCNCLRELSLNNIPLSDEGFFSLALAIRKRGLISLKCRNCKLSDSIGETVVSLIQFHSIIQREAERKAELEKNPNLGIVCLSSFDFRDNNLTTDFLHYVEHDVEFSPVVNFDLRGNLKIFENDVNSAKIYAGENNSLKGRNQPISREIVLEAENKNLRETLDKLVNGQNVAILMDDLFAVGQRAPELAEHINRLDDFCEKLENDQFYQRTVNRGPSTPKHTNTPMSGSKSSNPKSSKKFLYPRKTSLR